MPEAYNHIPGFSPAERQAHRAGRSQEASAVWAAEEAVRPAFLSEPARLTVSLPRLRAGDRLLDRFEIKGCLRETRNSIVYAASDSEASCDVALKVGTCERGAASELSELEREARIARLVAGDENVVRMHDLHVVPARPGVEMAVLSMEYADGGSFRDWLSKHHEQPDVRSGTGLDLFRQMCAGVSALHEAGVLHLDLKPSNWLFIRGKPKLGDLGSAVLRRSPRSGTAGPDDLCVRAGPGSTPQYMCPELFHDATASRLDETADIYSLGIVLYELLVPCCRPPFLGSYERIRKLHLTSPVPSLPPSVPPVSHVIARCTAKRPEDRYPSVDEFLDGLDEALDGPAREAEARKAERLEQCEDLWIEVELALRGGDLAQAFLLSHEILSIDSEYSNAKQVFDELWRRYEEADRRYENVTAGLDRRSLIELAELVYEANWHFPGHPAERGTVQALYERAKMFLDGMDAVHAAVADGSIVRALRAAKVAQSANPGSWTAAQLAEEFTGRLEAQSRTRERIDAALLEGKHEKALILAHRFDERMQE